MVEHVTFLGSRRREELLGTGARSNAYTDFHHTVRTQWLGPGGGGLSSSFTAGLAPPSATRPCDRSAPPLDSLPHLSPQVFHYHCPLYNAANGEAMLPRVLEALEDIAFQPEFLPTRIEKERKAVLSEAQMMNTIEYRIDCQLLQYLHEENALGFRFPIGKTDLVSILGIRLPLQCHGDSSSTGRQYKGGHREIEAA